MHKVTNAARVAVLVLLGIVVATAGSAHALSLLGQNVTGELFINGGSENEFDPENGEVPDMTYGNSTHPPGNGTNVVAISDTLIEFGYAGSTATFTANFTGSGGLTVMGQSIPTSFTNVGMNFSSPGFAGLNLGVVTDGSMTCSLASTTVMCNVTAGIPSFSSTFSFSAPTPVPEPASLTLLALGLTGIFVRRRMRK